MRLQQLGLAAVVSCLRLAREVLGPKLRSLPEMQLMVLMRRLVQRPEIFSYLDVVQRIFARGEHLLSLLTVSHSKEVCLRVESTVRDRLVALLADRFLDGRSGFAAGASDRVANQARLIVRLLEHVRLIPTHVLVLCLVVEPVRLGQRRHLVMRSGQQIVRLTLKRRHGQRRVLVLHHTRFVSVGREPIRIPRLRGLVLLTQS